MVELVGPFVITAAVVMVVVPVITIVVVVMTRVIGAGVVPGVGHPGGAGDTDDSQCSGGSDATIPIMVRASLRWSLPDPRTAPAELRGNYAVSYVSDNEIFHDPRHVTETPWPRVGDDDKTCEQP